MPPHDRAAVEMLLQAEWDPPPLLPVAAPIICARVAALLISLIERIFPFWLATAALPVFTMHAATSPGRKRR